MRLDRGTVTAAWIALLWLFVLTLLNRITGGALRGTFFFAVPVCIVAWYSWQVGFVVAALAILCARFGLALSEPGSDYPVWAVGLVAFAKLSIDAVVANVWGRRTRARTKRRQDSP